MGKKIAVFISGGGTNLQALIDSIGLGEIQGEISLVISNRQKAYGLERARINNIPALYINKKQFNSDKEYDQALLGLLSEYNIDLIVLAGYLSILSPDIISNYKDRIINIHPSLIPSFCGNGYYGEKVHRAVLEYGVKITGATVHFVDEETDTGPIIMQQAIYIGDLDNVQDIQDRVLGLEHQLLKRAVKYWCQGKIVIEERRVKVIGEGDGAND